MVPERNVSIGSNLEVELSVTITKKNKGPNLPKKYALKLDISLKMVTTAATAIHAATHYLFR